MALLSLLSLLTAVNLLADTIAPVNCSVGETLVNNNEVYRSPESGNLMLPNEGVISLADNNTTLVNDTVCGDATAMANDGSLCDNNTPEESGDTLNCSVTSIDNCPTSEESDLLSMESDMPGFVTSPELHDAIDGPLPENKTLVTILTTVTYFSDVYPVGAISAETTRFALQQLMALPNWLPNYELTFELIDDNADNAASIEQLVTKMQKNDEAVNRFPLTTLTDTGDFAQWITAVACEKYNFVSFTLAVNMWRLFTRRSRFPSYYGLLLNRPDIFYIALLEFMRTLGWSHVGIISEVDLYTDMMDRYLVAQLEEANFTTIYMAKFSYESQDEEEMSSNFEILKARDTRIIISQALSNVNMACWLHRYGMYGPNYVIFALNWNGIDETAEIPDYLPWCTKQMLLEVLPSMMWFGDGTMEDVFGDGVADVTGVRTSILNNYLTSRIFDVEPGSNSMTYWAPYFYDRALYIGMLLNRTEELLNERNETLSDWFTSSPKFQENGSEIVSVVKEAIRTLIVTGVKGDYSMGSDDNPTGFVPFCFIRVAVENETSSLQTIAYYRNDERKVIFIVDNVNWGTFNGQPPKDKLTFMTVKRPVFPVQAMEWVFQAIAGLLIAVSLAIAMSPICVRRLHKYLPGHILPVLIGNVLILIHTFVISAIETSSTASCASIVIIIFVGFSLINGAIAEELHKACSSVPSRTEQLGYKAMSFFGPQVFYKKYQTFVVSKRGLFAIAWPVLQLLLLILTIALAPTPPIHVSVIQLRHIMSPIDPSLAFKPYRYECSVAISAFERSTASCAFLGIVAVLQVYLLMRMSYFSYFLHANRKRVVLPVHLSRASRYLYCEILIIVGGFFVGAMDMSNGQYLLVTSSSVVIVLVILNLSLIVIPQLKVPNDVNDLVVGERFDTVRQPGAYRTIMNAQANQAHLGQRTEMFNARPRRTTMVLVAPPPQLDGGPPSP